MVDSQHPEWQQEADEEFLSQHRSDVFGRIRRLLGMAAADAISQSEIPGVIGGAPRNPNLRPGAGPDHSTHISVETVAHTEIVVTDISCPRCGGPAQQTEMLTKSADQQANTTGTLTVCPACNPGHWSVESNMPSVRAGRERDRKNVL